ncbi:TPA: hypothetical protein MIG20_01110 [Klebsiella pneumoniae]|nr:hypothetical protein [Klebsiella pneumoniae]
MTDITELAQREKFEAWFKSSFHPDKTGPYIKDQLYFAWKAAGAELVEALEKAQQRIVELDRKNCELNSLTQRWAVERAENADRIAGLEARTVKLPDLRQIVSGDRYVWSDGVYNYSQDVKVALAAAGIKVEAE